MSGRSPYLAKREDRLPTRPYRIRVRGRAEPILVDPGALPLEQPGQPGSLLASMLAAGVDIEHACGGVCACSTCHVYVRAGAEHCSVATDDEEDMLDGAPALTAESRLACQCVPDGSEDVEVEIPSWNRNQVREG